ncbi:MAG: hypothetical protein P8Y70_00245 [Candidatus Lokiarchaeota archaeon]
MKNVRLSIKAHLLFNAIKAALPNTSQNFKDQFIASIIDLTNSFEKSDNVFDRIICDCIMESIEVKEE